MKSRIKETLKWTGSNWTIILRRKNCLKQFKLCRRGQLIIRHRLSIRRAGLLMWMKKLNRRIYLRIKFHGRLFIKLRTLTNCCLSRIKLWGKCKVNWLILKREHSIDSQNRPIQIFLHINQILSIKAK